MSVKVAKFGGSSLADAKQFRKVKKIIEDDEKRRFVVPSAPGKRDYKDEKITDQLYACAAAAGAGEEFDALFKKIAVRYKEIVSDLELDLDLSPYLNEIYTMIGDGAGDDYAASRGEYLNGIILAEFLGYDFIDAKDVIFFNEHGALNSRKTQEVLSKRLREHVNAVIPGFYGVTREGNVKTFSRGGSDITGAIVARAAQAEMYENWTDVSGFLMADPRVVINPNVISVLSYSELRELAYMGATVLHEDSIFPVRRAGIPINVRNTNFPDEPGTLIVPEITGYKRPYIITGIAGRKNFTIITIEKDKMNVKVGFVRKVLSCLEELSISFEHMPTGIDSISLVIADKQIEGKLMELLDAISERCEPDNLVVNDNMAIIATVGHGMIRRVGISARLFGALAAGNVNVRMIDQGSSEMNIIIGVENDDFETAVKVVYEAFIKNV